MKQLLLLALGLVGGAALSSQEPAGAEYMFLPRGPLRSEVERALIAAGELEVLGDPKGVYLLPETFEGNLKIAEGMRAKLAGKLEALSREGWELVCHDAAEDNYILVRR